MSLYLTKLQLINFKGFAGQNPPITFHGPDGVTPGSGLKEALQKPLLPSRMEQKCSVQFFLTTPGGAVFFTNIIVKYYYDHIHNLVILWKSCSMAN